MWIRHKNWSRATTLVPLLFVCHSGRRYLWTGADGGKTFVPYRADIEELLQGGSDAESPYQVAYEAYGVLFDATGKFLTPETPVVTTHTIAPALKGLKKK